MRRLPRGHARSIAAGRQAWLERSLSAEPADRARVEAALSSLYRWAGMRAPPYSWVASPMAGARLTHQLLLARTPMVTTGAVASPGPATWIVRVRSALDGGLRRSMATAARRRLGNSTDGWLEERLEPVRTVLEREVSQRLGRDVEFASELQTSAWWPASWHQVFLAGGNHLSVGWLANHDLARELGVDYAELEPLLDALIDLSSAGSWWAFDDFAVLNERPSALRLDEARRLHAPDEPAVAYGADWWLFAWHGTLVPRRVVDIRLMRPGLIVDEPNAELRRMMLERYGLARFRRDARARLMHEDHWGRLWRVRVPDDEPITTVEVVNATPEPDGSVRHYELRVPPAMQTAVQAVAWTFGMSPAEYEERMSAET